MIQDIHLTNIIPKGKNNMETHSDDNAEPFSASRGQSETRISIGRSIETSIFPSQLSVNI